MCVLLFFAGFGIIPSTAGGSGEVVYTYSTAALNHTELYKGENISESSIFFQNEQSDESLSLVKEVVSEFGYPDYVPGSVLVIYETDDRSMASGSFDSAKLSANAAIGATVTQEFTDGVLPGCQVVSLPDDMTVDEAVIYYEDQPGVAYVQPNFIYTIDAVPNDPSYGLQWGLKNMGQSSGGTEGADISAEDAWDISTGSDSVVIAVICGMMETATMDMISSMMTMIQWMTTATVHIAQASSEL